jgi:hypothetical protein
LRSIRRRERDSAATLRRNIRLPGRQPCARLSAPNDVFISIMDSARFKVDACGAALIVYYDGEAFHRM